jgi:putative SOS response-associated peptidase YedK
MELRQIISEVERLLFQGQTLTTDEVRPTDIAPVVTKDGACAMKWGFPGIEGKGVIRHARSETIWEKKLFSEAAASRRCIIPATGFFEWGEGNVQLSLLDTVHQAKMQKIKFLFTLPGSAMFYLAGLYSYYALGKLAFPHFVIMTAAANASVMDVHDRMPVILRGGECAAWLTDGKLSGTSPLLLKKAV